MRTLRCVCVLITALLSLPGCGQNAGSGGAATPGGGGTGDGAQDAGTGELDAAELVIGRWTVDPELTRQGWGDRAAELERTLADQLGMTMEFKDGNQLSIVNNDGNGETYDVYWEITNASAEVLETVIAEEKDAAKKIQVKMTFTNEDQLEYESSEAEFEDDLVLRRATQ